MKLQVHLTGAKEVRERLLAIGSQPAQALNETIEELEEFVEGEVGKHSKTGTLTRSIYKRHIADGWELGHDLQVAPHALFVHWGARPHVIKPKNKRALRWPSGGQFRFAKEVHHPGNKPDPWMARAAALAPTIFARRIQSLLAKEASNAPA